MLNVVKSGFKENGMRNYQCTPCGRQFVRTTGTIFYRSRIKRKEAKQIANLLVEKNGIRSISRVTGRNRNTILSFTDKLAGKCKQVNQFLLRDVELSPIEIDELWTFVKKSKRKLKPSTIRIINRETATLTSQSKGKANST
ncbi:MAG: IS1 family transposase [Thaumarchaeota archaeon]|nr:IS1 family transposase [Nitrososphaerota archaeon]